MCRNIRTLHHFEPPTTIEEVNAAALQYVRKISGMARAPAEPTAHAAFETAIAQVAEATTKLLAQLPERGQARTREGELHKARLRWQRREMKA